MTGLNIKAQERALELMRGLDIKDSQLLVQRLDNDKEFRKAVGSSDQELLKEVDTVIRYFKSQN